MERGVMPRTRYTPPPEQRNRRTEADLLALHPLVHEETEHQLRTFYPAMDRADEVQTRRCIYQGIRQLLSAGVARVGVGGIEFWNPAQALWQEYDESYNALMLGVMAEYSQRPGQTIPRP